MWAGEFLEGSKEVFVTFTGRQCFHTTSDYSQSSKRVCVPRCDGCYGIAVEYKRHVD